MAGGVFSRIQRDVRVASMFEVYQKRHRPEGHTYYSDVLFHMCLSDLQHCGLSPDSEPRTRSAAEWRGIQYCRSFARRVVSG